MALDADRARRAIEERVARPLGLPLEAAAQGILDIVNNNMVGAIRLVSVERGYDPRDFALVPFGGAGPLHGADLAALLGMRTIVVPRHPGRALDVRPARHRGAQRLRAHESAEAARLRPRRRRRGVRRARRAGRGVARRRRRARRRAPGHAPGRPALPPPGVRADRAVAGARSRDRSPCSRGSTSATASSTPTRCPTRRSRSSRCAWPPPGGSGASRIPSLERRRPARARAGPPPRLLRRRRLEDVPVPGPRERSAPARR